ncbi:acyl-CoA dehydrogenase family protein [Piscinibacter sakaiensis]|uniref:Acyl-[acyl-carrier-protein] dehydrogenase MbtN n=1 Tax=Piscinibacter sakaiensis TaxID=1547922 RepID=A0A0K8P3R6_PISS1|nr:acyl-CoA dehydrogenase family protein [Piscinibacter sakaiensis]GAP37216.1 butyryl-CoA dehydrogenase [Piscinibacter sakaiensis]
MTSPYSLHAARRPWMDAELEALRDTARRFFTTECVPRQDAWAEQKHPDRAIWRRAGELGLLCPGLPEAYGGGGGHALHEMVICEEQAYAMANGFSINVHGGIVAHYLLDYGTEAQKQRWLPSLARGERVAAIAMTEPGAGTDLQRIKTSAVRDGDHYVVSGAKTFITNGLLADLVVVAVKTDPAAKARGVSLLVLETEGLAGFRRGRLLDKIGQKAQDTVELFFDEVRVPVSNLLGGEEGKGFAQLMQQLPRERLLLAGGAAATMQRAIDETLAYVQQRQLFGAPLMAQQNTRFKLAECQTKAVVARSFVDDCIARLARSELDVPTAAMAKLWITEALCEVVDECLQLHGGYGYMNEYPIARMYADARVSRIYGGANEVMKEIIARGLAD